MRRCRREPRPARQPGRYSGSESITEIAGAPRNTRSSDIRPFAASCVRHNAPVRPAPASEAV